MADIKVGVIGCGSNSDNHLRVYARTPGVRLEAVCDSVGAKAEMTGRKFGVERVYNEPDAMLKLDMDLVDIVTPATTHSSLAIQALETGHNVLVEKPMSLTSRECAEMISAAKRNGKALCVNHNKRFYSSIIKTKQFIEQEGLNVSRMHLTDFFVYSHMRPSWTLAEESGGIFFDAMVHHAYLLEHFLGRIDRVTALARKIKNPVYDSITLLVESKGLGGLAEYEWDSKAHVLAFQVFTEEGIRFDGDLRDDFVLRWPLHRAHRFPRTIQKLADDLAIPSQKWRSRMLKPGRTFPFGAVSPYKRTFYILIGKYLAFLAGQAEEPPVPPEEGLRSIEVLEAARKSVETGRREAVNHVGL